MSTSSDDHGCAMRGTCGTKGWFGQPLPCPYKGPPEDPETSQRDLLLSVCGPEFASGPVCCTEDQVETLQVRFGQVENIIASCPACRNNFRSFFCNFTCSPRQGTFLNVTETQKLSTGKTAVKSVDFFVGDGFSEGFYDSCKDVQFGVANDFAMTLIGGGAKNSSSFLKFLGDEKDLGSPFQINFKDSSPPEYTTFNPPPRNCADNDLASRCTCIDCPSVCQALPYLPPPNELPSCQVGQVTCLTFFVTLLYAACAASFLIGYTFQATLRRRRERRYERVALAADNSSIGPLSPRSHAHGLVGTSSLARPLDGGDSVDGQSGGSGRLGRGASLLDPIETLQPRQYRINTILRRFFYQLGIYCAHYPWLTSILVLSVVGFLNMGWKRFTIETDPVRLWVAADSDTKLQKEYFDDHFGPFYRTEQLFITAARAQTPSTSPTPGNFTHLIDEPVLSLEHLRWLSDVQADIRKLKSPINSLSLSDVCFKPAGPRGPCVVQTVTAWFGDMDDYDEDTWKQQLVGCAAHPVDCLPEYQQPLAPAFVLGAIPSQDDGEKDWLSAKALVVTYVIQSSNKPEEEAKTMEWERTLREYLEHRSERAPQDIGLRISFSTGVSLEEELNKSTNMDTRIVILSYLVMFLYIALTLGSDSGNVDEGSFGEYFCRLFTIVHSKFSHHISTSDPPDQAPLHFPRKLFVNSRFAIGLFGILLVILSISSSVGFFSFAGVSVTLIIAEVIPFLVLAVGVDNVFILVHELDRQTALHGPNAAITPQLGLNPGVGAPTPPLRRSPFSSLQEDVSDAISVPLNLSPEERVARTLAKMGPSILLSSVTECTAFALGALVPMPAVRNFALYAAGSVFMNAILQVTIFISALTLDLHRAESNRVDCFPCIAVPSRIALVDSHHLTQNRLTWFIRKYYAPFILQPFVKGLVLLAFGGIFVLSVISVQHIELGLDQRLPLPSDSYLIPYFDALEHYFDVGPPVYFVVTDINSTLKTDQRHLCGRFTTCDPLSLANVLEAERKRPEVSYISQPTASWIDDFFSWLDPSKSSCCRVKVADPNTFCRPTEPERLCKPCLQDRIPPWNITMDGLPEGDEFMKYLGHWLESPSDEECPLGGQASYSAALSLNSNSVVSSHFRTLHSPLRTQRDFINAFHAGNRIADDISERIGYKVFAYSPFYVFFEQYAHITAIAQQVLGLGLAAVLVITAVLLGSWRTGTIVTSVVGLTVLNVMGVMGIWHISLNALSLVNLVISLGLAVEFCAHIARSFMGAGSGFPVDQVSGQKERDERVWTALVDVGPSVLSGITFTKLIGISVLGLTRSKLLEMYYFRMWFTLIISGALHGLVLLPVVLSLAGGPGYALEDADEEWMNSATRRHDYEYTPFLADDDSIGSE